VHAGAPPQMLVEEGTKMIKLEVAEKKPEAVLDAFKQSSLTAADFRSDVVFSIDDSTSTEVALMAYACLMGFSGRKIDIAVKETIVDAKTIFNIGQQIQKGPAPEPPALQVQVGAVIHPQIPTVSFSSDITPEKAALIHFAKRLRFAPAQDPAQALTQLLVIAGLRKKNNADRLPFIVEGTEVFEQHNPLAVAGFCLDTLRSASLNLRKSRYSGDRTFRVEKRPVNTRDSILINAAQVPIEYALVWLGGRLNEETNLWHCPRPERHNNGDANASMRVSKDKVRCFRCDGEQVDSLRLTMDVKGLSPDQAAAWLLTQAKMNQIKFRAPEGLPPPHAENLVG